MMRLASTTLFLSAFLLFCAQLMIGKMLLPLLGGAASVWTTALLFFQAVLLAGYVYAHGIGRIASLRTQTAMHVVLMLAVLAFLPFRLGATAGTDAYQNPVAWELWRLVRTAGLPLFVISATAPLLQAWYARATGDVDPYSLYAASNGGSLLALLVYPFVIEQALGARRQSLWWSGGYGLLLLLMLGLVLALWRVTAKAQPADEASASPPTPRDRAYWLVASLVPSGLMLAVTTHISVNLTPMPLLWVLPLGIYLLTFILAFSSQARPSLEGLRRMTPAIVIPLCPAIGVWASVSRGDAVLIGIHMILLFVGASLCHLGLAASRPSTRYLTQFYVCIALGGALGGLISAVAAPAVFTDVFEYPALLAVAMFFRQPTRGNRWATAAVLAVLIAGVTLVPRPFVWKGTIVSTARNFFGVKRVVDEDGGVRKLYHGNTLHGTEARQFPGDPLAYFHKAGPLGDVMNMMRDHPNQHVGVVGLGAGSIAAYASPLRRVTFFEIDPAVEDIAEHSFGFLSRCGSQCRVVIGDGRLAVARFPEHEFDLLVLDAFSSDAIPPHLLSREALDMYLSKVKPGGAILFHVSNRYLNVKGLVAALVSDAHLAAFVRLDGSDVPSLKTAAEYVLAAAPRAHDGMEVAAPNSQWKTVVVPVGLRIWTDDYSNLIDWIR